VDREFYFVQRLCLLPWLWLQRRRQTHRLRLASVFHRLALASGFSRSVPTATTAMLPMPARPTVIMGRATSIMAFSWAWAHGPTGAMATAGVTIASSATVEDAISAVTVEDAIQAAAVVDMAAAQQCAVAVGMVAAVQHAVAAVQHEAAVVEHEAAQQYVAVAQHAAVVVVEHVAAVVEREAAAVVEREAAAVVDIASRLDVA